MKEYLFLTIICILFILYSIFIRNFILKFEIRKIIILITFYLVSILVYFEVINQLDHFLSSKLIYLEFGHANLMLVMAFFLCGIMVIPAEAGQIGSRLFALFK